jgi:DNA polymerase I
LSHVASQQRLQVIISTGDKDMAQLVNAAVSLVNTMSQERLDVAGVTAKFGVPPERIIDYLTLMGDTVDNVPGVDKVGPKTAAKWIAEYGSLEGVMAAAPSMKGAVGENLRRALEWLPQAKRLVTVVLESDLSDHVKGWPALDALALGAVDVPGLLDFYARYGFKSLRKELLAQMPLKAPHITPDLFAQPLPCKSVLPEGRYETVLTWEALDAWLAKLQAAALAALDTETTSLNPLQAQLVGLSFSTEPGVAAYVPLQHNYPGAPEQLPQDQVLEKLRPWLENPQAAKVGQNIKYDLHVLQNCGVTVRGYQHDTLLQSYVLEAHQPHGLESLAQRHLGRKGLGYEELCGKGAHQISFTQVDVERATQYAGEDSEMTLQLHQYLYEQLQAQPQLLDVYQRIEMPTAAVLQTVERHGVCIDASLLATQSQQLGQRLIALEQEAYALAGQPSTWAHPNKWGRFCLENWVCPH